MVALLLFGIILVNPNNALKTSAVTIQDEWAVTDNTPEDEVDDSFGGFGGDDLELSESDANADINPMSLNPSPTISLTIGKTTIETSTVQGGNTAYATNTVTLTGSYVKDYTLSIKAGAANLTMPTGADSSTSTISAVGTTGVTGSNMSDNKWGYAVTETSTTDYAGLTYKTTPTTATTIASGAGNTESSTSMNISKQLVFAAKFGSDATPGTYNASITLSATATPNTLTMANITDMQDMTPEICAASAQGQTATLVDRRGDNISYKIIKMLDDTCWMAQNLRLMGTTIDSTNSDMASGSFTIPASSISEFTSNDKYSPKAYYNNDTTYGAYYNWYTATAGFGVSNIISAVDTDRSICPKRWQLPAYEGVGSFYNIISGVNGVKGSWTSVNGKNGYKLGYNSNDAFFPAAGSIFNSSLGGADTYGHYWSRRARNSGDAYSLNFGSSYMDPQNGNGRASGYSVRCVASS